MAIEAQSRSAMRIQEGHAHAQPHFRALRTEDYPTIMKDIFEASRNHCKSLTAHLPLEVQHPSAYPKLRQGLSYIGFAEAVNRLVGIKLHWENAPICNEGSWDLKYGQTVWDDVPKMISLCLDTGHIILCSGSVDEARTRVKDILWLRGEQISHLHLHVNNLISDQHVTDRERVREVFGDSLLKRLLTGRTCIYEIGSATGQST